MSEVISQRELRNNSGRIMRELDKGSTFVVTRNNQPIGELRPLRRHRLVEKQVVREVFKGAPAIDAKAFRHDIDDILDQDVEPRE